MSPTHIGQLLNQHQQALEKSHSEIERIDHHIV